MNEAIKKLLKRGFIAQDKTVKNLSQKYLQKAKNNLVTMRLLSEINTNKNARKLLNLPTDYNSDE